MPANSAVWKALVRRTLDGSYSLRKSVLLSMKSKGPKSWLGRALSISIVLHLLLAGAAGWILVLTSNTQHLAQAKEALRPPLVFEFENSPVVETPESAKIDKPRDKPKYHSDKNARAQNEQSPQALPLGEAYSNGISPLPEPAEQQKAGATPQKTVSAKADRGAEKAPRDAAPGDFSREYLTRSARQVEPIRPGESEIQRPQSRNVDSRAPDLGGFSINTYEWDFAPYMIRLKRKIEKNIYPPPAFTRLGIISGVSRIRFRILRDGTLDALEVVGYTGHQSLMATSVRAIEVSAPFEALPESFPEKFLEITGEFNYFIKR